MGIVKFTHKRCDGTKGRSNSDGRDRTGIGEDRNATDNGQDGTSVVAEGHFLARVRRLETEELKPADRYVVVPDLSVVMFDRCSTEAVNEAITSTITEFVDSAIAENPLPPPGASQGVSVQIVRGQRA